LHNPAYAGIYAYGRSTLDPRRRQPGRPCTGRVRVGRDGWLVYLPGVLPAYVSIEQYERNMQRLDANRSRAQSMGAVRDGPALLAGLVASLPAAGQARAGRGRVDRMWRQRLERADCAAGRARRQYQLAEPENRLVVRQLEKDWEAALAGRQRLGEEYDRFAAARF